MTQESSPYTSPLLSAPCELLLQLFSGPRGEVHLGRLMRGEDAGRFVMLREVGDSIAARLGPSVDLAAGIAHPKLLKLLGLVRAGGCAYLACEYVPGAALSELRAAVRTLRSPVRAAVAARILRDALEALETARALLSNSKGREPCSAFDADSIWIAEFGETLVVPIGGKQLLAAPRAPQPADGAHSAIELLLELATALPATQVQADGIDTHLPGALAQAVLAALPASGDARSQTQVDAALLAALAPLQAPVIAEEKQVAEELERFLGQSLEQRRRRQRFDEEEGEAGTDEATVMTHSAPVRRSGGPAQGDSGTQLLRRAFAEKALEREHDPDGVTQVNVGVSQSTSVAFSVENKLPSPASISNPGWPQQFLEQTQLSARKGQSGPPPPQASSTRGLVLLAALTVVLALALIWVISSLGR